MEVEIQAMCRPSDYFIACISLPISILSPSLSQRTTQRGPARLAIHPRDPLHLTPAQLIVTVSEEPITQDQLL
jgi:hypothetical protein